MLLLVLEIRYAEAHRGATIDALTSTLAALPPLGATICILLLTYSVWFRDKGNPLIHGIKLAFFWLWASVAAFIFWHMLSAPFVGR